MARKASDKVTALPRGIHVTVSQIAEETGIARETVAKRLKEASVKPAGKRASYVLYRLRDALPAVYQLDDIAADPERMDPFKRQAYYRAELERRKLEVDDRLLIPAAEVEAERARVFKLLTQALESLPDVVERDLGLPAKTVARIEHLCDRHRDELHAALVDGDEVDDAPDRAEVRVRA